MDKTPCVWVVTHSFPPNAEVGGLRPLGLCQHLAELGWQVTVLCAEPQSARSDIGLVGKIPPSVKVVRTKWFDGPAALGRLIDFVRPRKAMNEPSGEDDNVQGGDEVVSRQGLARRCLDWLSLWMYVPDGRSGWFLPALIRGMVMGIRRRPDIVFATGPTWTGLLVGYFLALMSRAPLVLDFRDPWIGSAFHSDRDKYKSHCFVREWLERLVVRRASRITCAWEGIRQLLLQRYPEKKAILTTIVNGFDENDFKFIQSKVLFEDKCVFLHAGNFYSHRSPEPLLVALRQMIDSEFTDIHSARFVFLGDPTYNGRPMIDIVKNFDLQEYVHVLPSVPQRDALTLLAGAQVAVLFGQSGSETLASIPAKTFEYIGLGKPVLAVGAGSEVCTVLEDGGCPLWRVDSAQKDQIVSVLKDILTLYIKGELPQARLGADKYRRQSMARKIETIFDEILESKKIL